MPDEGGIEFLRDITTTARHPQVIMMSALRDREIARQAMKLGAFDYILKPIDLESLSASITGGNAGLTRPPLWRLLCPLQMLIFQRGACL